MSSEKKNDLESEDLENKKEQPNADSNDLESNLSKLEKDLDIDELPQEARAIVYKSRIK